MFILNRVQPIPLTLREGTSGKVTKNNDLNVGKEINIDNLIPLRVTSLIPQSRNKANNPRKIRLLEPISLMHIVEFLDIILMNVLFYLTCIRHRKLK